MLIHALFFYIFENDKRKTSFCSKTDLFKFSSCEFCCPFKEAFPRPLFTFSSAQMPIDIMIEGNHEHASGEDFGVSHFLLSLILPLPWNPHPLSPFPASSLPLSPLQPTVIWHPPSAFPSPPPTSLWENPLRFCLAAWAGPGRAHLYRGALARGT